MNNKEKYTLFCNSQKTYVPIFSQPWWLDSACGEKNWDVYLVEKGGDCVAAMPYYIESEKGHTKITKAKNTQNNGIIIAYPEKQKYVAKLDYEDRIIEEVIRFIESLGIDKYEQQYHFSFENWLPFYWNGYQAITRYTYIIDDASDMEKVEEHYTSAVRNKLRNAERRVSLRDKELEIEEFYKINRMSFERQGKEMPYDLGFVKRIYEAGQKNNAVRILAAEDRQENIHSVALLVWDEESVYYLLNGTNPEYKSSQANCFLIHESIRIAGKMGKRFDFEGSVIRPIEKAFRGFGGIRKPYFRISKEFHTDSGNADKNIILDRLGGGNL